jgi:hypothetical protein
MQRTGEAGMKDKLRELAAELEDVGSCDDDYQLGRAEAGQEIAKRISAILDAEGDGGTVFVPDAYLHTVVDEDGAQDQALSFSSESFPLQDVCGFKSIACQALYLDGPARSGVVSDEDVVAALKIWNDSPALGRDEDDAYAMRAALEHFTKGERHE